MSVTIDGTSGITTPGLTNTGSDTLSAGTANGVAYLNGSKVLTTGTALTFDGSGLAVGDTSAGGYSLMLGNGSSNRGRLYIKGATGGNYPEINIDDSMNTSGLRWQIYSTSGSLIFGDTTNGQRMRIDSGGNVGLGVTPSTWSAGGKVIEIGATGLGIWGNSTANFMFVENAYYNGGWKYASTNGAAYYQMLTNSHAWYNAPSGTAGTAITFTQAMTLDASGNLGIGVTSPSVKLQVDGGSTPGTIGQFGNAQGGVILGAASSTAYVNTTSSSPLAFQINGTERARIDSSGNWIVGTTSSGNQNANNINYNVGNGQGYVGHVSGTASGTGYFIFSLAGTAIGSITQNGTTAVAYNTSSDYRLKENVQPMIGALAKVQALKPCTYNWKADGSAGQGFIAHELQAVVPDCVTGEKDAVDADGNPVYQGIDTSFLVATLTAAIQEQQALIQSLTARIAALEGAK